MKALYDTRDGKVRPYPRTDGKPVEDLEAGLVVMELNEAETPSYDPATERLEPFETVNVKEGTVTRGLRAVQLPAEQMEARAKEAEALATLADVGSKPGTVAERLARLEKLVAHLMQSRPL